VNLLFPSVIVHEIDAWSPLWSPPVQDATPSESSHNPAQSYLFPDIQQREGDEVSGNREGRRGNMNSSSLSTAMSNNDDDSDGRLDEVKDAIRRKLWVDRIEILCMVEGVDSLTSSTIQARHSYISSDIEFDHTFARCVVKDVKKGTPIIDFGKFHDLTKTDKNCATSSSSCHGG
jgi:hypothetical protein